jgi:hypothetical protein
MCSPCQNPPAPTAFVESRIRECLRVCRRELEIDKNGCKEVYAGTSFGVDLRKEADSAIAEGRRGGGVFQIPNLTAYQSSFFVLIMPCND